MLLCGAAVAASAGPAPGQGWWNLEWPYRRQVTVGDFKPTKLPGEDIAVVTMPTGGLVRPGGASVRVVTARGIERPCRVLMTGPGDVVRIAFALRGDARDYFVYFGHPKPPARTKDLDIRRGVLLETWAYPGGGVADLKQVRTVLFGKAKQFIGATFLSRVFLGHNPFGPQDRVASIFTGALVCPAAGEYTFSCSSRNASFLLVDDQVVVDNSGWHSPQRDIRKRGKIRLDAGLHRLTVYHVSGKGHPIVVAAWQPPGESRVRVIPSSAFARVATAEPGPMRKVNTAGGADFLYDHAGETWVPDRYYQRYAFRGLSVGNLGRNVEWRWDFGDGQTASGPQVEHVFLLDGPHQVTLTARSGLGEFTRTNSVWVTRPWDQATQRRLDRVRDYARIVAKYDFDTLSADALREAGALTQRVGRDETVIDIGRAFVARTEVTDRSAGELMPIFAEALVRADKAGEAVAALESTAGKVQAPETAAELLLRAGRIALDDAGEADRAARLFQAVTTDYGHKVVGGAIRQARIGLGDVHRARGDYTGAEEAYATAGVGKSVRNQRAPVARGDFARRAEDFTRRKELDAAAEALAEWAEAFPADKLDGYWSLLAVRLALARQDSAAAVREAEMLVRVHPASNYAAELLQLAWRAYGRLRRKDKAEETLRRIVSEYPESPLAEWASGELKKER